MLLFTADFGPFTEAASVTLCAWQGVNGGREGNDFPKAEAGTAPVSAGSQPRALPVDPRGLGGRVLSGGGSRCRLHAVLVAALKKGGTGRFSALFGVKPGLWPCEV